MTGYARYSEKGTVYVENMERLLRKFETAKNDGAGAGAPRRQAADADTARSISARPRRRWTRRRACWPSRASHIDALRVRGFPFDDEVVNFVAEHDQVFVVEQNRDAQMRTLLDQRKRYRSGAAVPVLHYDGTPITARFIIDAISPQLASNERCNVCAAQEIVRLRKAREP